MLFERLDWSAPSRPRPHELLGEDMAQAGLELGPNTPYGTALLKCGEAQKQIGGSERKFIQSTSIHFLSPLRRYTEGEYRVIQAERKLLLNKRLDLDIAKTRLRKAHEADREAGNLNANPLGDDYVVYASYMFSFLRVKWLKMWAQEISQAEMELRICQSLFERQAEVTRQAVEGIRNTHASHMGSLADFVEAQACYYAQCHLLTQELQKQMASLPAVFCSNNWQSTPNRALATSHGNGHPIPANRAAIELTDLLLEITKETNEATNSPSSGDGTSQPMMTKPATNQTTDHPPTANQRSAVRLASNQAAEQPAGTNQATSESPAL